MTAGSDLANQPRSAAALLKHIAGNGVRASNPLVCRDPIRLRKPVRERMHSIALVFGEAASSWQVHQQKHDLAAASPTCVALREGGGFPRGP